MKLLSQELKFFQNINSDELIFNRTLNIGQYWTYDQELSTILH